LEHGCCGWLSISRSALPPNELFAPVLVRSTLSSCFQIRCCEAVLSIRASSSSRLLGQCSERHWAKARSPPRVSRGWLHFGAYPALNLCLLPRTPTRPFSFVTSRHEFFYCVFHPPFPYFNWCHVVFLLLFLSRTISPQLTGTKVRLESYGATKTTPDYAADVAFVESSCDPPLPVRRLRGSWRLGIFPFSITLTSLCQGTCPF